MASILRQIVAGPRSRHAETGLDLCYVTDHIIATSGPSQTYPQLAYRNPLDQLVKFLDSKHGNDWAIWEFRAEGTGYPDEAVYNRIRHYPWPDHHPPPFRLMPLMMASMRNWLHGGDHESVGGSPGEQQGAAGQPAQENQEKNKNQRVVVVHCKAGKGRSGTVGCSYLISEEGWKPEDALARFTERRMRPKFGAGVTIPSQLRWITYIDRWTHGNKKYLDRPVEIVEIHVWGLRSGVKIDVEGFADEGKRIKAFHTFKKEERFLVDSKVPEEAGFSDMLWDMAGYSTKNPKQTAPDEAPLSEATNPGDTEEIKEQNKTAEDSGMKKRATQLLHKVPSTGKLHLRKKGSRDSKSAKSSPSSSSSDVSNPEPGGMAVILKPSKPIIIPNSDVNISVERRNKTPKSMGLALVTAVAHVWFNIFFEGQGPEQDGRPGDSGVFSIDWDAMDGIKGSSRKGTRAMDRISVVWRVPGTDTTGAPLAGEEVLEPAEGQPVPQSTPADWKGTAKEEEKDLGFRVQSPASVGVSRASSIREPEESRDKDESDSSSIAGVRASGPAGEDLDLSEGDKSKSPANEKLGNQGSGSSEGNTKGSGNNQ